MASKETKANPPERMTARSATEIQPIAGASIRHPPPWSARLSSTFAAALFLAITLLTHLRWLISPLPSDLDLWIRVARDWAGGSKLYVEAFDIKLPPVFWLVRLLDSSNPALTWYLAEAAYMTIAATALFAAMRRAAPIAAFVAPILMIVWTGVMGTGQGTEAVALALDVTALSLCVIATHTKRWWLTLIAGVCAGLMIAFRPPTLLHLVAYLPVLWVAYLTHGRSFAARAGAGFLAGVAVIVFAVIAHAIAFGYWAPFLDIMRRNAIYASVSGIPLGRSIWLFFDRIAKLLMGWHAAPLLAMLTLAAAASRWRALQSLRRGRLWLVVAVLWLAAAAAGTFPGGRHFEHYYHTLWAPLAVLGALWLTVAFPERSRRPVATGLVAALLVYTVGYATIDTVCLVVAKKQAGMAPGTNKIVRSVATDLNRLIPPGEIAPVCVWSQWAELLWRVRRPSLTPALVPILFLDMAPDLFDQWVAAMLAHPPNIVVFDYWGMGPSSRAREMYKGRPRLNELQKMLGGDYVEIRRWDDLYVLARRGGPYDPAANSDPSHLR